MSIIIAIYMRYTCDHSCHEVDRQRGWFMRLHKPGQRYIGHFIYDSIYHRQACYLQIAKVLQILPPSCPFAIISKIVLFLL